MVAVGNINIDKFVRQNKTVVTVTIINLGKETDLVTEMNFTILKS